MGKRMLFVVNPLSGKGTIKNSVLDIVNTFTKDGWDVTVHPTQHKDDASEYVCNHGADYDMLVISGGDGTLNEGICGLMTIDRDKRPVLGYIPAGTTNDFASNMRISKNVKKAAKDIMNGHHYMCDIGLFNEKNFVYVAAFGAFTNVAYETPQQNKNILGHAAYVLEGAKNLTNLKPISMQILYNDGLIEGEFIYGMVSNTNYIGGVKAEKAFKAQLNDGFFEVILVKNPKNVIEIQDIVSRLLRQDLSSDAFVVFKTDQVKFVSNTPVQWTLDGEFGGAVTEAAVINEKQAITLALGREMEC